MRVEEKKQIALTLTEEEAYSLVVQISEIDPERQSCLWLLSLAVIPFISNDVWERASKTY